MNARLRALLAAGSTALLVGLTSPAAAADATFSVNGDTWVAGGVVADPHVQAGCATEAEPLPVIQAACPTFTLVIDSADPLRYLDVELVFESASAGGRSAEDYDLHLYDASGTEIASAANAIGAKERLAVNHLPNGTYTLEVVPYTNVPGSTFSLSALFRTASS